MKQYRGYYIDHVIYHSESDIDNAIKSNSINRYKMLCEMFANKPSMELSVMMSEQARFLHDSCGMDYDEIEAIEIEAIQAA